MGQIPPPLHLKWPLNNTEQKKLMAMFEINKHADSLSEWLFWKYGKGPTVTVKWPVGPIEEADPVDGTISADPNDHYRPYLEKNVGRQNRDWVWGLRDNNAAENRLTIKFRKSKAKWATAAFLLWA